MFVAEAIQITVNSRRKEEEDDENGTEAGLIGTTLYDSHLSMLLMLIEWLTCKGNQCGDIESAYVCPQAVVHSLLQMQSFQSRS
jgi:hypothetical protein